MKIASISIADYWEATAGMPHDAERLYFRMILKMLSREGGLPDDDADNARLFGYDRRVYQRLKAKLVAWPDAIYLEDGLLKNARVEKDIAAVKESRAEAVENGRKGGAARAKLIRKSEGSSSEVREKFAGSLPEVCQKSNHIPYATDNENNDIAVASPSPSPREVKKESGDPPASVEQDAEGDGLASLNGTATMMVRDVLAWMPHGTETAARKWLASTVRIYGSQITEDAYQKLGTDMANGQVFSMPLSAWSKIARRLKDETGENPVSRPDRHMTARERKIAGDRECLEYIRKMSVEGASA